MIRLWSPPTPHTRASHPAIAAALKDCRRAFSSVALFSAMVNLLMLAGPLYMLQVYDRVLASHSVPTLIALSVLLCGAFALQASMDLIRNRVVTRSAGFLDEHLSTVAHKAIIRLSATGRRPARRTNRYATSIKSGAFSPGKARSPLSICRGFPVFLLICWLIHPWLGMLSLVGGIMLATAALLTERASRAPAREANRSARARSIMLEADRRNSETTTAMGLEAALTQRWQALNAGYLAAVELLVRRDQLLCQPIQDDADDAAVGVAGARRLPRDRARIDAGSHDRLFDHDGARAGADRNRYCQLARVRCSAR